MVAKITTDLFVIYKGEEVIAIGTATEAAEQLGIPRRRIIQMSSRSMKVRAANPASDYMIAERVPEKDLR